MLNHQWMKYLTVLGAKPVRWGCSALRFHRSTFSLWLAPGWVVSADLEEDCGPHFLVFQTWCMPWCIGYLELRQAGLIFFREEHEINLSPLLSFISLTAKAGASGQAVCLRKLVTFNVSLAGSCYTWPVICFSLLARNHCSRQQCKFLLIALPCLQQPCFKRYFQKAFSIQY